MEIVVPIKRLTFTPTELAELVAGVKNRNESAILKLFGIIARFRFGLKYLTQEEREDVIQDSFLAILEAIQTTRINQPECLLGFIKSVTHHKMTAVIRREKDDRQRFVYLDANSRDLSFSQSSIDGQLKGIVKQFETKDHLQRIVRLMGTSLKDRDRDIINRFYLLGQKETEIRAGMNLDSTQYRLCKNRAVGRLRFLYTSGLLLNGLRRTLRTDSFIPVVNTQFQRPKNRVIGPLTACGITKTASLWAKDLGVPSTKLVELFHADASGFEDYVVVRGTRTRRTRKKKSVVGVVPFAHIEPPLRLVG